MKTQKDKGRHMQSLQDRKYFKINQKIDKIKCLKLKQQQQITMTLKQSMTEQYKCLCKYTDQKIILFRCFKILEQAELYSLHLAFH